MSELFQAMEELAKDMGGEQYIGELSHQDLVEFGISWAKESAKPVGYYILPVDPASTDLWDGKVHPDLFSAELSMAEMDKRDWYDEGERAKWRIVRLVAVESETAQ